MAAEQVMRRLLVGLLVVAALVWAGRGWLRPGRAPLPLATAADSTGAGVRSARLYFASPSGDSLVVEPREMVESAGLHDRVAALVAELDRGPRAGGIAALPAGTSVLHAFMDERGLLTLDLSRSFRQGFHGGAGAEYLALASLVRTLGANLPGVRRVLIVCGGEPLPTLGGHLPLDQPLDIGDWP